MAHMQIIPPLDACVVLEKSNTETRASHLYLAVHALPQEDLYATDDTSAGEIYPIFIPKSTGPQCNGLGTGNIAQRS